MRRTILWIKPKIAPLPEVKPIKLWHWLIIGLAILLGVTLLFFIILPERYQKNYLLLALIICGCTLMMTSTLFSIRLFLYGVEEEKNKIWQEETQYLHQQWQNWAMQSLAILDSVIILPDNLSSFVDSIVTNSQELELDYAKINQFKNTDKTFYSNCFDQIFANIARNLNKVEPHLKLIIWLDNNNNPTLLEKLIYQAANKWQLKQEIELSTDPIYTGKSLIINQLIDDNQPALYLIISNNAQSQTSSAFISALLMVNTQLLSTMDDVKPQSYLLRSMLTTQHKYEAAIQQMLDIQPAFNNITQCWHSQINGEELNELTTLLNKNDVDIVTAKQLARHDFDGNFGIPNKEMSYWLLLALANQACQKNGDYHLVATKLRNDMVFSLLCPEIKKWLDK
jgi:hypothetical protein